jgi:hypothetical protein
MVAGLTDHLWTLKEIFTRPLFPPKRTVRDKTRENKAVKEPEGG